MTTRRPSRVKRPYRLPRQRAVLPRAGGPGPAPLPSPDRGMEEAPCIADLC
ncbi:hypothetical protein J8J14_06975 [Roseomonas sp. SSH11]|uniref:Uncharacterized protein n=1 Tax=Pararoseomonas baculiformis TaxID=2820812 RepID=A0ABS4ACC5_9PROT|nr:hypothetical protein [Pararoseomonas baculiformis]MBP0444521.1 hypothetical protein [Pararoseomonas baculiformis]